MTLWADAAFAYLAAAAAVATLRKETRHAWVPWVAPIPILASTFGGALPGLALATAFLVALLWPPLAVAVPLVGLPWLGVNTLAVAGAWTLGQGRSGFFTGLAALGVVFWSQPYVAIAGALAGAVGFVFRESPANAAQARILISGAPFLLPVPALALFGFSTLGRAGGSDWRILALALAAVAAGAMLAYAATGCGIRLLAADGNGASWISAILAAGAVFLIAGLRGRFEDALLMMGPLLVVLSIASAPVLTKVWKRTLLSMDRNRSTRR